MPRSPSPKKRKNGRRSRRSPVRAVYEPPMFPVMSTALDPYFMSLLNVNTQLTQQIHVLQERIRQQELKVTKAPAVVEPTKVPAVVEPTKVPAAATVPPVYTGVLDSTPIDLELLGNIASMPLAVQERMNSTLEIYTKKCKDDSKEAMMSDYVVRGTNFIEQVNAFNGDKATKEYIQTTYNELKDGFEKFERLDIQVRKDMCRKEVGTSTETSSSPSVPFVNMDSRTDAKEIAIPQLNYNYTFRCNGEEASETMVEWMKREPHYANATDKKCVIVDKSLICISGTASGKVFKAGQKLSNEFQVFLVDDTTGWVCIGRKKCESVWDTIRNYSAKIAQAMFAALKMAITASSKVLNVIAGKLLTVVKFSGNVLSNVVYTALDAIKTATKHLFTLQFKAFLMLVAGVASGLILRAAIPLLIKQLGLEPFTEAASLANTSAVLLKHKDALPAVLLATTNASLAKDNTFAVNALLGASVSMITQLNTSVPFFQYVASVLNIPPKFSDEKNSELDKAFNLTNVPAVPEPVPYVLPPPPPPPSQPPANFSNLADNVFSDATKDVQVSPSPLPTGGLSQYYEWLKKKIGEDNLKIIIPLISAAQLAHIGVRLAGGDWTAWLSLIGFIPKLAGLSTPMYTVIETISSNPTIQAAIKSTMAARAVTELTSNLGPYWQLANSARRLA